MSCKREVERIFTKAADYHPNFAKNTAISWLNKLAKQKVIQKMIEAEGKVAPHPLLKLLDLISIASKKQESAQINIAELKQLIDDFAKQGFDFHVYLQIIKEQEGKNIFVGLAETMRLPERTSFILFQHLHLPEKKTESVSAEESKYFGYFWLANLLLARGNYQQGIELLVEMFRSAKREVATFQANINAVDNGCIVNKMIFAHGWQTMIESIKSNTDTYTKSRAHDKDNTHQARVEFAKIKFCLQQQN